MLGLNRSFGNIRYTYIASAFYDLGYGVFVTQDFDHQEFLLEYPGVLIDPLKADDETDQTFLYYFQKGGKSYW